MIGGMNCQIYMYTYTYVCLYLYYTFTYTCAYRHGSNGSKSVKIKLSSPSHQQYTACTMVKHGDYGLWSSPNNWAILNTSHSDTIGEILNSQVICATLQSPSHWVRWCTTSTCLFPYLCHGNCPRQANANWQRATSHRLLTFFDQDPYWSLAMRKPNQPHMESSPCSPVNCWWNHGKHVVVLSNYVVKTVQI